MEIIIGAPDQPRIWLCWAQSLDGAIAADAAGARPTNLTHDSPEAEAFVHRLRAAADAIVVGVGTICSDDPRLTVRLPDRVQQQQPDVVVLDPHLRTPPTARIFSEACGQRRVRLVTTVQHYFHSDAGIKERANILAKTCNAVIHIIEEDTDRINIGTLVRVLAKGHESLGVRPLKRLHVEGGAQILAAFAPFAHARATLIAPILLGATALRVAWPVTMAAATRCDWLCLDKVRHIMCCYICQRLD
jgi:riboflavin-specific deaminase-like protein